MHKQSKIGGLSLERKDGQIISIDNGRILIEIVESTKGRTRIAIKAPKDTAISRAEIMHVVKKDKTDVGGDT